jgi:CRP-like cAMP-binding protein
LAGTGSSTVFLSNSILASLRADAREFIVKRSEVRRMETGDVIYENGALVTHAVFPLEGVISYVAEFPGSRSFEKASLGPEGYIGFVLALDGDRSLGKSVVQVPGRALWLAASNFGQALERYQCVRSAMLRQARALIVQLMETAVCNSLHTAEQRVSRWLLHAHDRVPGDEFLITQEMIAQLLALRRATVNAVCSELMSAGAIAYNRGHLTVTDRDVLHARSCTCYDRIRRAMIPCKAQ